MADENSAVADRARAVLSTPGDLRAWLRLADALDAAGEQTRANEAFAALGKAANELGQVALAVAIHRWLADKGQDAAAGELATAISTVHCAGSERIDRSSRPRPPVPPRAPVAAGEPAPADPLALADAALKAARAAVEDRVGERLPPTPLLNGLSADEIVKFIGVTELQRKDKLERVVETGEPARTLFWLASGLVAATRDEALLGELAAGAFFGEIGLVMGTRRTARVTCVEDCWLLAVPARKIEAIAESEPHLADVLAEYARDRLLANVMRTSEILRRIDESERRRLLVRFETGVFGAGKAIVAQGQENDRLHVIVSGQCRVVADGDELALLTAGDGFGEISLLSRRPAMADVVAVENTVTLSLTREAFDEVAAEHPELLAEVYKLLVARERENQALFHDASDLIL